VLLSLLTDPNKIKPFDKIIPDLSNNWLKLSYEAASELTSPVSMETFNKVNEEVLLKLQKPKKRPRALENTLSIDEEIINLNNRLDAKIFSSHPDNKTKPKYTSMNKKAEILNSFTVLSISDDLSKASIENIITIFEELVSLNLSKEIIRSSGLLKCLKLFKNCLEVSNDPEIKNLVKVSDKILKYWAKVIIFSEFINTN
jgi:hypothetical protein